jgi:hypothetical protein
MAKTLTHQINFFCTCFVTVYLMNASFPFKAGTAFCVTKIIAGLKSNTLLSEFRYHFKNLFIMVRGFMLFKERDIFKFFKGE